MRFLRLASLGVAALGVAALGVVIAPGVLAQPDQRDQVFSRFNVFGSTLGATVRDVTDADVTKAKLASATGAVIESVQDSSAAAQAGFKAGDVVLSFDNENVRSARHLQRLVEETPAGRTVAATVMRAGERVSLKVTLADAGAQFFGNLDRLRERPGDRPYVMNPSNRDSFSFAFPEMMLGNSGNRFTFFSDRRLRLGIGVQDLTAQLGEYFGTSAGVLVTEVDDASIGKTAGLRAGDVITKVNDQPARSTQDLRRLLNNASGEISLTVMRDRKEQTLKVKLEDEAVGTPGRTIRRRV